MVSLPAGSPQALGCLATSDFNLQQQQQQQVQHQFAVGDQLTATVAALPSEATGGRLLLCVPLTAKPLRPREGKAAAEGEQKRGRQQQQHPAAPAVGSCVEATVGAVHAMHADLLLQGGCHGRLHITEAAPLEGGGGASPLSALSPGATLSVAVVGRVQTAEARRHGVVECSTRPEAVAAAKAGQVLPRGQGLTWGGLAPGQQLHG